jgi:hypothetical protein
LKYVDALVIVVDPIGIDAVIYKFVLLPNPIIQPVTIPSALVDVVIRKFLL